MAHNVPWTHAVETEFRARVYLTPLEERVFNLHMAGCFTQKQIASMLTISPGRVNRVLGDVKRKYKLAALESSTLPPFLRNRNEITQWQQRQSVKALELPRSAIAHLIDEWVFDERYRSITKRRLLDGTKFEELAIEFDMSVRQIKNIVYECEDIIHKHA